MIGRETRVLRAALLGTGGQHRPRSHGRLVLAKGRLLRWLHGEAPLSGPWETPHPPVRCWRAEHQWRQELTASLNVSHPTCPVLCAGAMSASRGTPGHDRQLGVGGGTVYGTEQQRPRVAATRQGSSVRAVWHCRSRASWTSRAADARATGAPASWSSTRPAAAPTPRRPSRTPPRFRHSRASRLRAACRARSPSQSSGSGRHQDRNSAIATQSVSDLRPGRAHRLGDEAIAQRPQGVRRGPVPCVGHPTTLRG